MMMYTTYSNYYRKQPFADLFAHNVRRQGRHHVAIRFEDTVWTLGDLDDYSNRVANHLLRCGFKSGDKLFLLLSSSPQFIGIWLGAAKIGVATGLLNTNLSGDALRNCINTLNTKGIVVGDRSKEAFLQCGANSAFSTDSIWYVDETAISPESAMHYNNISSAANWNLALSELTSCPPPKLCPVKGREHLLYMYTSGTTGLPKVALYIGELCRYLLAQPPKPTDTQHQIRLIYGNGLRPDTWIQFMQRFKVPLVGELYGATESNCSIINCDFKVGAIGFITQLVKGVYPINLIKMDLNTEQPIRDSRTGFCIECAPNEPGQLVGRISNHNPTRFFDGYADKEASEKRILRNVFKTDDTWLASGDLLYQDDLGYLYFSDRLGDTFRWRGENVSTKEVESILLRISPDLVCVVYGVPVPGNEGKAGMAAIQVEFGKLSPQNEQEIIRQIYRVVSEHLPSYARPLFLRLCESIEMTSTFKWKKNELAEAGFDPNNTKDHLYWLDAQAETYRTLDPETFELLKHGSMRL
ncbi:unnamed protein product [Dicrocoelium dendriticum]|nr:unnamed protein product [Dicrocoelium dendriticum]